jgi:hypothetical protein
MNWVRGPLPGRAAQVRKVFDKGPSPMLQFAGMLAGAYFYRSYEGCTQVVSVEFGVA